MISAATGAIALLMVALVRDHGLEYLFAATILTGVFQIVAGLLRLGALMRFVSRSVMTGFVNALAILIFMAQLPELIGVPWLVYADGRGRARDHLPASAADHGRAVAAGRHRGADAIVAAASGSTSARRRHGRAARLAAASSCCPTCRSTSRRCGSSCPTRSTHGGGRPARVADDRPDRRRHDRHPLATRTASAWGQGIANIVTGFFGGMARLRDDRPVGDQREAPAAAAGSRPSSPASFLLILVVVLGDVVAQIPMAALVAVMIMVSIGTFNWRSIAASAHASRARPAWSCWRRWW